MNRGLPRPRHAGFPIPYNVSDVEEQAETFESTHFEWTMLDSPRHEECQKNGLCMLCGLALGAIAYGFVSSSEMYSKKLVDEGWLHLKCMMITWGACPHLKDKSWTTSQIWENRQIADEC